MEKMYRRKSFRDVVVLLASLFLTVNELCAQESLQVIGQLLNQTTYQAIPYANVALFSMADSSLVAGTTSNSEGHFAVNAPARGSFNLCISAIGFNSFTKEIDLSLEPIIYTGVLMMQEMFYEIGETFVVAERIKAKSSREGVVYHVNQTMNAVSCNSIDIIKQIPGVQVDILQNITLEGKGNIVLLVDGVVRDREFLRQLDASQVEKIEVNGMPDSRFDAEAGGVVNIILKKERDAGFSGSFHAEIPSSPSQSYLFPAYGLTYGAKNVNLHTAYNGELAYLDLEERSWARFNHPAMPGFSETVEVVRQKYYSHRFHLGVDWFIDTKNQINLYGFVNPFSRELDGQIHSQSENNGVPTTNWMAERDDDNANLMAYGSAFFKHEFDKPGCSMAVDLSLNMYQGKERRSYDLVSGKSVGMAGSGIDARPKQRAWSLQIDHVLPVVKGCVINLGARGVWQLLADEENPDFEYHEGRMAFYGKASHTFGSLGIDAGLRWECSHVELDGIADNIDMALMPHLTLSYGFSSGMVLKLSARRSVNRPRLPQLNPYAFFVEPYHVREGCPSLKPSYCLDYYADWSMPFRSNYLSLQLFYGRCSNVISWISFVDDHGLLRSRSMNVNSRSDVGAQLTGAFKLHNAIDLNVFMKCYSRWARGKFDARPDQHEMAFESGGSANVSIGHGFYVSLLFQYNTPKLDFQAREYCDALYLISIDKTIGKRLKAGVSCVLPFSTSFVYQGREVKGEWFDYCRQGIIHKPALPFIFKLNYQFVTGKRRNAIKRANDIIENRPNATLH